MPNRMIRDEILESERVLSLPADVRWFFLSVLLTADDLGLFEATAFKLARRATLSPDQVARFLQLLIDVDLVRLYVVDRKQYGFVPRFRQRIQIKRSRHPLPPEALTADDDDALSKIKDLGSDPTDGQPLDNGFTSSAQQSEPEAKAEEEKESSSPSDSPTLVAKARASATYRVPHCPTEELVALYHRHLPALPAVEVMNAGRRRALSARWRDVCADGKFDRPAGLEWFGWFFERVAKSDFLMGRVPGRSGRTWKASFDFLVNPTKFARVVEGAYTQEATQ
jgi:hypothetical protein